MRTNLRTPQPKSKISQWVNMGFEILRRNRQDGQPLLRLCHFRAIIAHHVCKRRRPPPAPFPKGFGVLSRRQQRRNLSLVWRHQKASRWLSAPHSNRSPAAVAQRGYSLLDQRPCTSTQSRSLRHSFRRSRGQRSLLKNDAQGATCQRDNGATFPQTGAAAQDFWAFLYLMAFFAMPEREAQRIACLRHCERAWARLTSIISMRSSPQRVNAPTTKRLSAL